MMIQAQPSGRRDGLSEGDFSRKKERIESGSKGQLPSQSAFFRLILAEVVLALAIGEADRHHQV